jgi:hypothetical protein
MEVMKRLLLLLPIAAGGLVLAGCGSGAKQTAHYTTTPPTTISGVGVTTSGPPPKPSTPLACATRWNSAANRSGRVAAEQKAANASAAVVRRAGPSGYFSEDAGRCLVYLVTPPKSAVVFVETAPARFSFTAYASGHLSPNADLRQSGRLHLR